VNLVQLRDKSGARRVAASDGAGQGRLLVGCESVYELATAAIEAAKTIGKMVEEKSGPETISLAEALADGRVLAPIDHPDPAHLLLTGTGLTHLGSADARDKMHKAAAEETTTDSMRMFRMGLEGGKPRAGEVGVQPEWFYKGDGQLLTAPGQPLISPAFGLDAGEEPEIAGIYVIGRDGTPFRIGFALANEFSDHVTERGNYLWLAHSKLRPAALGPELLVGDLPADIHGSSRVLRNGEKLWEKPFLSGEQNMSHTVANLEHHHFKYEMFRRPGDVHVHFFGTATLSFADAVKLMDGDEFEISAEGFGMPLRNRLEVAVERKPIVVAL
jgi:hypothetical protein